ncbi:MAG: hypothetical protein EZS28_026830 [Streblomastix strix]|uniref:Uncharacterized protein n=1 Tax=Streblomastix strix TaxID=222440 RepID=A0A5J4V5K4_9EUKA|nr:MAG: hypothetical protein EZS28_026830 [Streblomastix strix]
MPNRSLTLMPFSLICCAKGVSPALLFLHVSGFWLAINVSNAILLFQTVVSALLFQICPKQGLIPIGLELLDSILGQFRCIN